MYNMPVEKQNESNQKSRRDDMSVEKHVSAPSKKSQRDNMPVKKQNESNQKSRRDDMSVEKENKAKLNGKSRRDDMPVEKHVSAPSKNPERMTCR
jgi:hypothetical protein